MCASAVFPELDGATETMTYPIEDTGFIHWIGDVETQLLRLHGVGIKDLGLSRLSLGRFYYAGISTFAFLDHARHLLVRP